jgi:hypothetical protein
MILSLPQVTDQIKRIKELYESKAHGNRDHIDLKLDDCEIKQGSKKEKSKEEAQQKYFGGPAHFTMEAVADCFLDQFAGRESERCADEKTEDPIVVLLNEKDREHKGRDQDRDFFQLIGRHKFAGNPPRRTRSIMRARCPRSTITSSL